MKVEFSESEYGANITLTPESIFEVAQLVRFSKNARKEKPDIYMSFSSHEPVPYCSIWMSKVKPSVQVNSISNK